MYSEWWCTLGVVVYPEGWYARSGGMLGVVVYSRLVENGLVVCGGVLGVVVYSEWIGGVLGIGVVLAVGGELPIGGVLAVVVYSR